MGPYRFETARDLFEAARDAAIEARRASRQIREMELRAGSLGGGGFEPRVRSTPDPDRMGAEAARRAERTEMLESRMERDYALIDAATWVLYGSRVDGTGGIDSMLGTAYADVIHWHYLAGESWERVGDIVGYSPRWCRAMRDVAFDCVDGMGMRHVMEGVGIACD